MIENVKIFSFKPQIRLDNKKEFYFVINKNTSGKGGIRKV